MRCRSVAPRPRAAEPLARVTAQRNWFKCYCFLLPVWRNRFTGELGVWHTHSDNTHVHTHTHLWLHSSAWQLEEFILKSQLKINQCYLKKIDIKMWLCHRCLKVCCCWKIHLINSNSWATTWLKGRLLNYVQMTKRGQKKVLTKRY